MQTNKQWTFPKIKIPGLHNKLPITLTFCLLNDFYARKMSAVLLKKCYIVGVWKVDFDSTNEMSNMLHFKKRNMWCGLFSFLVYRIKSHIFIRKTLPILNEEVGQFHLSPNHWTSFLYIWNFNTNFESLCLIWLPLNMSSCISDSTQAPEVIEFLTCPYHSCLP